MASMSMVRPRVATSSEASRSTREFSPEMSTGRARTLLPFMASMAVKTKEVVTRMLTVKEGRCEK
jgi:hypothetical protein